MAYHQAAQDKHLAGLAHAMAVGVDLPGLNGFNARKRIAFLRERAAHFRSLNDDEALNYAADLECEADELEGDCNRGPLDA